jgi:protein phosphatase 1 regulatory subunit 37
MQLNDVLSDASSQPVAELAVKAHAVLAELTAAIQDAEDAVRLQELLGANDQLCSLLAKVPAPQKPTLVLQGLGAVVNGAAPVDSPGTADLRNGRAVMPNGVAVEGGVDEEADTPTTPRIDKGKGRAKPEPEVPEKVLSPTFLITESESEDEEAHYVTEVEAGPSPTDRFVRIDLRGFLISYSPPDLVFGLLKRVKYFARVLYF